MANSVDSLVRRFLEDLRGLMREELAAEVNAAVEAALGHAPARQRRGTRPAPARSRGPGGRSAEQIAKQAERVLGVIQEHPGSRSEQIAKVTGLTTAELVAPLGHLLKQKEIRKAGVARGTTYTVKG